MTASQHIGRTVQALHAQLNLHPQGHTATYEGQGFAILARFDTRYNVRYRVRTGGRIEAGISAVWSCLEAEHRGIEAAARAELEATWAAAVAELPVRAAPLTPDAWEARMNALDAAAGNDEASEALEAAELQRRAAAFVRVSEDWAADAWAAAEVEQLRQGG